jgi:GT2 family glycosyltransferase
MNPHVCIIILNWNNWQDTIECLESVFNIEYQEYQVIVVDNCSKDDSINMIKKFCQDDVKTSSTENSMVLLELEEDDLKSISSKKSILNQLKTYRPDNQLILIKNSRNYGFTKGNNIGIKFVFQNLDADYILLLNNDTIVDKHFLNELVRVGESDQNIGFVGPKIYFYEYVGKQFNNIIQYAGGKQNLWIFEPSPIGYGKIDQGQYEQNRKVDFISGACMLAKTPMIREIGLLDEEFFSYREENDWCMRANKKGWSTFFAYKAVIWHKVQGSTKNQDLKPFILYYMTKNRFLFMKKHAEKVQLTIFLFYFFLFDFWYRITASLLYHQQPELVSCLMKAVKDGLKVLTEKI